MDIVQTTSTLSVGETLRLMAEDVNYKKFKKSFDEETLINTLKSIANRGEYEYIIPSSVLYNNYGICDKTELYFLDWCKEQEIGIELERIDISAKDSKERNYIFSW